MSVDIVPTSAEVAKTEGGTVEARSLQIRSKLGDKLYVLIQDDLSEFYKKIRDVALGESSELPRDKRGNLPRSSGSYLSNHRKMYIELMKMANADIKVDSANIKTDIDAFRTMMSGLSTKEIKELVSTGEGQE